LSIPPLSPDLFDLDPSILWVMHCAEGPVPRAAAAAAAAFLEREKRPWEVSWEGDFVGLPRQAREQAARLLGARAEDITLTGTTTGGLARIAQGLPWEPGDEVVLPLGEFPANAWPWLALAGRGVTVRQVPLWDGHRAGAAAWDSAPPPPGVDPEERLLAALGPRTRLLSVSWVRFQDGLRLDLARLAAGCRERRVRLVVDGIQGTGTLVPAVGGLDAFACGGHKGLLAPQGLGFLWTAEELRRELSPPGGWLSVEDATDFSRPSTDFDRDFQRDGSRLEHGVPNLLGCAALAASLATLNEAGVERIEGHGARLQGLLLARLAGSPWAAEAARLGALWEGGRLGSILALHHGGRGAYALQAVLRQGFECGIHASIREGYLRIALHGWHTDADVERLARWLGESG
jgi:selenocysteine lyase/cysteine desulfurase